MKICENLFIRQWLQGEDPKGLHCPPSLQGRQSRLPCLCLVKVVKSTKPAHYANAGLSAFPCCSY